MKNHEIAHLTNRESLPDRTVAAGEIDQYSEKRKGRILRFKTMWKEKTT